MKDFLAHAKAMKIFMDGDLKSFVVKYPIFSKSLLTIKGGFEEKSLVALYEENYQLIYRIGMDTLPLQRKIALEALISTVAKVAQTIGYPQNSTRRILEDLQAHGLVVRFVGGNGRMDGWSLSDNAKSIYQIFKTGDLKTKKTTVARIGWNLTLKD